MTVEIDEGGVAVPAETLAPHFGVRPADVPGLMRDGTLTGRLEKGIGEDMGLFRLTFWHAGRQLRLTCDDGARFSK